jgi:hypothetical protein
MPSMLAERYHISYRVSVIISVDSQNKTTPSSYECTTGKQELDYNIEYVLHTSTVCTRVATVVQVQYHKI